MQVDGTLCLRFTSNAPLLFLIQQSIVFVIRCEKVYNAQVVQGFLKTDTNVRHKANKEDVDSVCHRDILISRG